VYTYGTRLGPQAGRERWPHALTQVVEAQHALWNTLVAYFERNRERYEALMQAQEALAPLRLALEAAQAQYRAALHAEKAARQQYRRRQHPEAQTRRHAVEEASAHAKAARQAYTAAVAAHRNHLRPQLTALLDTLWAEADALAKAAPLAWYNQRLVSDSFRRAVERFLRRQGGPPQRKHALTRAHLTYHFTGPPLTWEQLLGGKTAMIQIAPVPEWVWDDTMTRGALAALRHEPLPPREEWDLPLTQSVRRQAARTTATLRISDTESLSFHVTLMRRPPPGALIKGAELVGREVVRPWGQARSRWDWTFALVCEIPPETIPVREGLRRAAIDLNWRILDDQRIRVGTVWDGRQHTLLYFPAALVERWRHSQHLQQIVGEALRECKVVLEALWQDKPLPLDMQPEGWAQLGQQGLLRLLHAVQSRAPRPTDWPPTPAWPVTYLSPVRLVPLPERVQDLWLAICHTAAAEQRALYLQSLLTAALLPPQATAPEHTLEVLVRWEWLTGILWRELRGLQSHLERAKQAWYRIVAKELCTQYDVLAVEDLNLRQMNQQRQELSPRLRAGMAYRQLVAPGSFLQRLAHTAAREGVKIIKVDPSYSTLECAVCGAVLPGQEGELYLTCPHGHRYDVDYNATEILFRRAFAGGDANGTVGTIS